MVNASIPVEAIKKAYIDPVRTVMLVDDRFRTFAQLAHRRPNPTEGDPLEGKYEDDRAASLWEACRKRGWACDVENGPEFNALATARIRKSDLVVLDFHLVGEDPTCSLQIMRELAGSPGSNLVILYTVDPDLNSVRRRVAANLRGARRLEDWLNEEELSAWQDLPEDVPTFAAEHVDAFLRGEKSYQQDPALTKQLDNARVAISLRAKLLDAALENYVHTKLGAEFLLEVRPIQMSSDTARHGWVRQDNVFVVFVSKAAESGPAVFDALESALGDWSPSPLHLTAAYARESIARGGFRLDTTALSDVNLRTGLLYYAFEEESSQGFRHWYERLIESVAHYAIEEIADFGSGLITPASNGGDKNDKQANLRRAREIAIVAGERSPVDHEILAALNDFLCSEPYRNKHVRTGTIFCRADALEPDSYFVCVTPACDMVPREPKEEHWVRDLHPMRPMAVLRAKKVKMNTALGSATRGRYVFFLHNGVRVAAEVIKEPRQPLNEVILVEDRALTDAKQCFFAYRIRRDGDVPSFGDKLKMQAVAQLRGQYASRLLQETGIHVSRIGVDFVDLPKNQSQ